MAAAAIPKIKLNSGFEIPIVAPWSVLPRRPLFSGTGSYAPPDAIHKVKDWILNALKNGFRHIDTAVLYGTEKAVGEAIKESGIPREEIFVTTKLPWGDHGRVKESFETSLANLGTYIDLYLIHWPQALVYEEGNFTPKNADGTFKMTDSVTFSDSWAEFEKLLDTHKGQVRSIGVSNFSIKTLEKLLETAKIVPAVNQVELHPYHAQNALREYCAKKGIVLTAYTPSGYSEVRGNPLIVSLAEKYEVTPTQIIFAWHLSWGTVIIPKSENDQRQKENIAVPKISEVDIEKIWALDRGQRVLARPNPKTGLICGWTLEQLGWEDIRQQTPAAQRL